MKKAIYNVEFSKKGYSTKTYSISASIDGWYWGSLLIGGIVGMLIIDPATGAMFQLKETSLDAVLSQETANLPPMKKGSHELKVYDISDIPESWKEHLVKIED